MKIGSLMLRVSDDGAAYAGRLTETIPHIPAFSSIPRVTGKRVGSELKIFCVAPNRWK